MTTQVVVRLDERTANDLDSIVLNSGLSKSEAIREAIRRSKQEQMRAMVREQVRQLANDPEDVANSKRIAAEMAAISAW